MTVSTGGSGIAMTDVFLTVLNMSVTAAFVIAVLCLARLALRKIRAPKWISYALWGVAGFNLACPFKLESALSLIPFNSTPIPHDIAMQAIPRIDSGINIIDGAVSGSLPAAMPMASVNPLQIWTAVGAYVWLAGVAAMILYAVISYVRLLRRKDSVTTPFVYGFIRPKIHIPGGISGEELRYVTLHEQTHIKRRDYLVKPVAFALLCVHWFNPLAWAAFALLCADMEMSCDERVLRELGMGVKADYSQTLLSLSMNRRILRASPLAFGEGGIKGRIKNVLEFKKRSRIITVAAVAFATVLTVGFAVNTASHAGNAVYNSPESAFASLSKYLLIDTNALSALKTPYVGDNSAVGKIVDALPSLDGELTQRFFSIGDDYGTGRAPYTLTLYYEQNGTERNITALPKNAALLFALIDNLEEVSCAFRNTPSGGELDKAAYTSRIAVNKEQIGDFIGNLGLTWEDFRNDFETAAAAVFTQSAQIETPPPQPMFALDADNGDKMTQGKE
ncbi:MAG: DUF4825 domain-containing protein [Peptococcaceae bacterium]|jgi:beta-lactamase regulating signal transducer with metallopeptidase domain|nr:DUF4825 domain-containing protein [Peptococcaceae bacterium]